jgi:hypothetical protein
MKSFLEYINESTLSSGNLNKARYLIQSYLAKKVGETFSSAGLEQFQGSNGSGYGLRFYFPKTLYSVRFNWETISGDENRLKSIDFWMGDSNPTYHVKFDQDTSLVQILPFTAGILSGKEKVKGGKFITAPIGTSLNESTQEVLDILLEAYDMDSAYDDIIKILSTGGSKSTVWKKYKSAGGKVAEYIQEIYPNLFEKQGKSLVWVGEPSDVKELLSKKNDILLAVGGSSGTISKGSKESYSDSSVADVESNKERIAFEEQIEDLKSLVKLTVAGSSNALFVAGRGGIGKTYNVEDETLKKELGFEDGKQYFKNTGSTTPAGLYRLFVRYHDRILFFDDSDSTLDSQEARNLMKAATDTKAVRKIVWSKAGANVVEPDEYESIEDMLNDDKIPRYIEFTGKVIFISNLKPEKLDPDGAIRTRAFMIDIDPTHMEVFELMRKIVGHMKIKDGLQLSLEERIKVVDMIENGTSKQEPNFRMLQRALDMKAGAAVVNVSDDRMAKLMSRYA